jgi:hypothetical protein
VRVRICAPVGWGRFGGMSVGARAVRALCVPVVLYPLLALTPVAAASATSFVWAGGSLGRTESAAHWSTGENWEGDIPPISSQAIETLTFPHLTNSACESKPQTDTCYLTLNNLSGLTVDSIQLDDADDYLLAGEAIKLGSGGLTATAPVGTSGSAGAFMEMPIELTASQKWSIANRSGGKLEENGLLMEGGVTGAGSALTFELSGGPALILANSTEVGPVTIEGPNAAAGEHIANGISLLDGGQLNSVDHESVNLRNAYFAGTGTVGALTTDNATLDVGSGAEPAGSIEAFNVDFGSTAGVVFEITGSGSTAQADYSQLVSGGPVELAGVIVVIVGKPSAGASCPTLTPGQKYTFVSTTGTLSGAFVNAPENLEIPISLGPGCSNSPQTMRISYSQSGSTKTVTGTVEAKAKERQEQLELEAKEEEIKTKEIAQKEENRKLGEERASEAHAKKVSEEAALASASATKKREEETAVVARKRQEEDVAHMHEEEAAAAAAKQEQGGEGGTGAVSLDGSTISVQIGGAAAVKLKCSGTRTCRGKLTAEVAAKKGKKTKTEIGTVSFSVPPGTTKTIKLVLNTVGKALLSTDHGHLSGTLSIVKSSPSPSQTNTDSVNLVQQKARGKGKR